MWLNLNLSALDMESAAILQTSANDADVDAEEEQTGQPDMHEDVEASKFEQVGGQEPDSLRGQPGCRHENQTGALLHFG